MSVDPVGEGARNGQGNEQENSFFAGGAFYGSSMAGARCGAQAERYEASVGALEASAGE